MWGRMTKEEKQGYKELSDTDRKRFDIERKLISGIGGPEKRKREAKAERKTPSFVNDEGRRASSDESKMSSIEQHDEPKVMHVEAYIPHPENSVA